jgi:hypothetical protein
MRLPILLAISALLPVSYALHHLRLVKNEILGDSMFGHPSSDTKNVNRVLVDKYNAPTAVPATTPRISGGTITEPGQYPYFTTLASRMCGSTLIHPDILMTAGHCQKAYAAERLVFVGAHEVHGTQVVTAAETRLLIRQYPHPNTDFVWWRNDLTLFKLDRPANSLPVQLNSDPDVPSPNSTLTVIGFGATRTERLSDFLQEVDLYAVDPDTCRRQYSNVNPEAVDPATMVCASHPLPDHDSCPGDSGGPLLDKVTGEEVGIVSFGMGCGDPNYPGVYTRISAYTNWIHDRICELSAVPPADCNTTNTDPAADSVKVTLYIQYDDFPEEVFWRLEDKSTGQTIAVQPSIPGRRAFFSHKLSLRPGRYTLQVTDMQGDGLCCEWGHGQIVVSAHGNPTNSTLESKSQTQVLAQSDGHFEYRLALDFTVPPLDGGSWTNNEDTGDDFRSSNALIWAGVVIGVVIIVSALLVLMRPFPCCGK